MKILILGVLTFVLTGCASLEPDQVNLEADHVSHVSQHFGADATNYGYDAALVTATWRMKRAWITVGEGAVLDRCMGTPYYDSSKVLHQCGGLDGPRELFTVRTGITLWQKGGD